MDNNWCTGGNILVGPYLKGKKCPRCGIKMLKSTCASSEDIRALSKLEDLKGHYETASKSYWMTHPN